MSVVALPAPGASATLWTIWAGTQLLGVAFGWLIAGVGMRLWRRRLLGWPVAALGLTQSAVASTPLVLVLAGVRWTGHWVEATAGAFVVTIGVGMAAFSVYFRARPGRRS